ncbi:MAG: hypothetical protein PVG41_05290 [Desulfobacteraceae bacterium]|jgi:hypothetical protein
MLKINAKKKLYRLFPLLVLLYIAIGLPLVHPLLHYPSDDDHDLTHSCAHHHGGAHDDDDQTSECPVCHFISTSQWLTTSFAPCTPTSVQFETIAHVYLLPEMDIGLKPIKPRAPPAIKSFTYLYV